MNSRYKQFCSFITLMKSINKSTGMVLVTIVLSIGLTSIVYGQNAYSLTPGGFKLDKIPGLDKVKDLTTTFFSKDVKIAITAKVTSVSDFGNLLNGKVKEGDVITGVYTYKPSAKDTNTDTTVGDYQHSKKPYGIDLRDGNLVFKTNPNNVNFLLELVNRDMDDDYVLHSYNNLPLSENVFVNHISWQLSDLTGNAISSESLKKVDTPPKLNEWQYINSLDIRGSDSSDIDNPPNNLFFIGATVDSAKLLR